MKEQISVLKSFLPVNTKYKAQDLLIANIPQGKYAVQCAQKS